MRRPRSEALAARVFQQAPCCIAGAANRSKDGDEVAFPYFLAARFLKIWPDRRMPSDQSSRSSRTSKRPVMKNTLPQPSRYLSKTCFVDPPLHDV